MIRRFLAFFFLFGFSASLYAACEPVLQTGYTFNCPQIVDGLCVESSVAPLFPQTQVTAGCNYTFTGVAYCFTPQGDGSVACSGNYSNVPDPVPLYCADGSLAPNNDVAQCPPQDNFLVCADGTAAPYGDIFRCPSGTSPGTLSAQQLLEKTANSTDTSNAFLNGILGVVSDLRNKASQVLSAITDASYNIQQAINSQTSALASAVTSSNASVASSLTSLSGSISSAFASLGVKADHVIQELLNIQTTITGIAANFTLQLSAIHDSIVSQLSQVRSAVSSGAAMVKAAVDESALNIVNAINAAHLEAYTAATDFYADSLAGVQDLITAVGYTTTAISLLPDQIANAILTSEAFGGGGNSDVVQKLDVTENRLDASLNNLGTTLDQILDTIDAKDIPVPGGGNTVSGDCSTGFGCYSDDPVECAVALDQFKANCEMTASNALSSMGNLALKNSGTEFDGNPLRDASDVVDMSSLFPQPTYVHASCPADKTFTLMGGAFSIPYGPICDYGSIVGYFFVLAAVMSAIRIIGA